MHSANPDATMPHGMSWFTSRTRRVVAAVAALALAAAMAVAASMPAGDVTAAGAEDDAVVAGASWSTTRNLLRYGGPGLDTLGASWN